MFWFSLIVGWLVWLGVVAKEAQTPGKGIFHMYILDFDTGEPVSAMRVWLREVLNLLAMLIFPLLLFDYGEAQSDRNNRSLHDKLMKTVVVYAPDGLPYPEEQHFNIGLRLGDVGAWGRAVEAFNEALTIDPEYGDALGYRGLAYAELGEYGLAKPDLIRALELVDDEELEDELRQSLGRLDALPA